MLPWITPSYDGQLARRTYIDSTDDEPTLVQQEPTIMKELQNDSNSLDDLIDVFHRAFQFSNGVRKVVSGIAILAVPDPIPVADELFAVGLIASGTKDIITAF